MMFRPLCALLALFCGAALAAAPAKPLVFCADAGPEGFDPSLWDSASTSNLTRREAQAIFKRERPWITMAHSSVYIPIRRDVKGFVMSPNGSVDFEGVWRE